MLEPIFWCIETVRKFGTNVTLLETLGGSNRIFITWVVKIRMSSISSRRKSLGTQSVFSRPKSLKKPKECVMPYPQLCYVFTGPCMERWGQGKIDIYILSLILSRRSQVFILSQKSQTSILFSYFNGVSFSSYFILFTSEETPTNAQIFSHCLLQFNPTEIEFP